MSQSTLCLMYHAILAPRERGAGLDPQDRLYAVAWDDWQQQLAAIQKAREFSPKLPPADAGGTGGTPSGHGLCLTFDDAWKQHLEVAAPALAERRLKAIFFISTGQVAQPGMMLWRDVRELADFGCPLGSHGHTHRFLTTLRGGKLREELMGSKKQLEDGSGHAVHFLSLPGGRYNDHVIETAKQAGYTRVFTSTPGLWQEGTLVPRVAVRAGERGTQTVRRLLADPFGEAGRLNRNAGWLRALQRILGDRLYHAVHRVWARV